MLDVAKRTIAMVSGLADFDFTINGPKKIPHITIYSPEFATKNLGKIKNFISELDFSDINFSYESPMEGEFHIGINFVKNIKIQKLHEEIVLGLNSFREGRLRDKYKNKDFINRQSPRQLEHIKRFGYRNLFEDYTPHLTLGMTKDSPKKEINQIIESNWNGFATKLDDIAIFEMGDHGTCTKIIC